MVLKRNEDLFSESSMSLGEHLEELRICLWKAVIWLVCGTVIGFYFGGDVVAYIQKPLNDSLEKYYWERSQREIKKRSEELDEFGYSSNQIIKIAKEDKLVPEISYIYREQWDVLLHGTPYRNDLPEESPDLKPSKKTSASALDLIDNLNHYARSEQDKKKSEKIESVVAKANDPKKSDDLIPFITYKKLHDISKTRASALGVHETFAIFIKASVVVGFVLGSPGIFYSLWSFVAAGLYLHERKYVYIFMPVSIGLFLAGAALAFFVVIKYVIDFLFAFNAWMDIDPDTRISEWMNFVLMLPIGFGISFQLPLVMFVLERVGILTVDMMLSKWRVAVLVIFVVSMLLTPSDPQSLILMAVPLCALYFLGIFMCYLFPKKKSEFDI